MPPAPAEPKLILPGFALAWATSSARLPTGSEGFTTTTSGTFTTVVMRARSLLGLKGILVSA